MKKTVIKLGICFLLGTVVVLSLFAATYKIRHEPNSFLREYQRPFLQSRPVIDLTFNSYYIAGITEDAVYLGNITAPFDVLVTNKTLTDSQHVKLRIKGVKNPTIYKSATIKIDPPYFFLADGIKPLLYRGKIGQWEAEKFDYDSGAYFQQLVPLGNNSFAIRTAQYKTLYRILGKVQQDSPRIRLDSTLLQKQVDGIFCTDGMLMYNSQLKRLVYTYYYRNEFILYDTNLNLDYRGHTIDTFSRAQLKIGYVPSDRTTILLDKKITNIRSCTSGNYLYISSNLLAKNDSKGWLDTNSIIDVYDLRSNTYKFSFILPHYKDQRMRDFMVSGEIMIVLYDNYMVKYNLQPNYL